MKCNWLSKGIQNCSFIKQKADCQLNVSENNMIISLVNVKRTTLRPHDTVLSSAKSVFLP
jgi:hypothetical protein